MNMDEYRQENLQRVTMPMCDKTVTHDVSGDYVLPEYQPEIRKVLCVSEKIIPPAKYISGSGVECNGNIDYKILYIGADGGLYSANVSNEYGFSSPIEGDADFELADGGVTLVNTVAESTVTRVTSPRKLNIKSKLRSHLRAYATSIVEENIYGDIDPDSIERLIKETENANICAHSSDMIELTEEISGISDDGRVISADGYVFVSDIRKNNGNVSVSGDVILKMLWCRDGGIAEAVTRKIPFSTDIECDNIDSDSMCKATGKVTDITIDIDTGRVVCNLSAVVGISAMKNKKYKYTTDIYSTENESECVKKQMALPYAIAAINGNFSQNERINISETNIPEGANIVDIWGRAELDSCAQENGKYVFSGNCKYTAICEKDGEYSVSEIVLPARYELDGEGRDRYTSDVTGEVVSCRIRVDGDTVAIDSEIAIAADILGENDVEIIDNVRFGEKWGKEKSRMVVYYPTDSEGVWDVAKKYHVRANSLSAEKAYYLF